MAPIVNGQKKSTGCAVREEHFKSFQSSVYGQLIVCSSDLRVFIAFHSSSLSLTSISTQRMDWLNRSYKLSVY